MRVAQVGIAHPFRGGIAHYTTSLHQALLQEGHSSFVISFSRLYPSALFPGKSQFDLSDKHFPIDSYRLLDSLNPLSWRAAARYILDQKPNVAVFHYWHPYFAPAYGTLVSRLNARSIPVVFICHNIIPHERHFIATFLRNRVFAGVRRFLVHSDNDRQTLERLRPEAKIIRAQHPVYQLFDQPNVSRESARATLGLSQEEKLVLFFGYVRPYKGLDTLLHSLPAVLKRQPVRLLIAGEFYGVRERYDKLTRDLQVQSVVTIHDHYIANERVALYFKAANLLVLPYHSATQSGVIPTAYFFDLPVVTTSVGGLPETVLDGRTGLLVPPENPTALAEAIVEYFQRDWEAPFRDQIRDLKKEFSWNRIVEGIRVLGENVGPGSGGRLGVG